MGLIRRHPGSDIAAITSSGTDKEKISYCQKCFDLKILSMLKHRIYLDNKGNIDPNPPPDSKNWKQCWTCFDIVPVYEAKQEADITTLTEPRANPFNSGKNTIQTVGESRKFDRTCKTQKRKQLKQDLEQYKEEDLKEALRKGGKLLNYS
jgi:hypothetical protein